MPVARRAIEIYEIEAVPHNAVCGSGSLMFAQMPQLPPRWSAGRRQG